MKKFKVNVKDFAGTELFVIGLLKRFELTGCDVEQILHSHVPRFGLTNRLFLDSLPREWATFTQLHAVGDLKNVEQYFGIKLCQVRLFKHKATSTDLLSFTNYIGWAKNIVYYDNIRANKRSYLRYYVVDLDLFRRCIEVYATPGVKFAKKTLHFPSANDLYNYFNISYSGDFCLANMRQIAIHLKRDIHIYQKLGRYVYPVYKPMPRFPQSKPVLIFTEQNDPAAFENLSSLHLILNEGFVTKTYFCSVLQGCTFSSDDRQNLKRHEEICEKIGKQTIVGELKSYGEKCDMMSIICNAGYLPPEMRNYRNQFFTTFDIETFEDIKNEVRTEATIINANHKCLSIAAGSTTGHTFVQVREDDSSDAVESMVGNFLDFLEQMHEKYLEQLPSAITDALEVIEQDDDGTLPFKEKLKLKKMKRFLEQYLRLDCYGFNSGL